MYSEIMDTCPYNHDPIDYKYSMMDIDKPSRIHGIAIKSAEFLSVHLWPIAAFILPPVAIAVGLKIGPALVV